MFLSATVNVFAEENLYVTYDCEEKQEKIYSIENWTSTNETIGSADNPYDVKPAQIIGDCNFMKIENLKWINGLIQ